MNDNNNNNKKERRRRLTFPVRRQLSYDRALFNREMFHKAYNPDPAETASASSSTSTSTMASVPIIECPNSDEPYTTYTGLSSPNLRPYKPTTDVSAVPAISADGLLKPPSKNEQKKRNNSPFGRDFGKEITDQFFENLWVEKK